MSRLPDFPEFKKIEPADRPEIEKFASGFAPYSDFNFASLYSWDVQEKMKISVLNGNLVVLFNDYVSSRSFLSFIGKKEISETARQLIEYSTLHFNEPALWLIPEEVSASLPESEFELSPDDDGHDYIYSVEQLSKMHEWSKKTQKKNIKNFLVANPNYTHSCLPISMIDKENYVEMYARWAENKNLASHVEMNEFKAFQRMLYSGDEKIMILSVYEDQVRTKLIGFTSFEIVSPDYAIAHYSKADVKHHAAIFCVLIWEEAKYLHEQGVKYYNWEQDLGIPGLRIFKQQYHPEFLLKKYTVRLKKPQIIRVHPYPLS